MKHSRTLIAAVAVLLPLAGTAVAGEGDKMKHGASFDSLDTNRDGRISRAEAAADANIVFSSADANGDGYLDNSEFKKAHKAKDGTQPAQPQSSSSSSVDTPAPQPEPATSPDSTTPPVDTETPRQ